MPLLSKIKKLNQVMLEEDILQLPEDIYSPMSLMEETRKLFHIDFKSGLPLRWKNFCIDEKSHRYYFTLASGELVLIGGVPSAGKSCFMNDVITQTIGMYGWKWIVFSPETGRPYKFHRKLVENISGKSYHGRWGTAKIEWNEVESITKMLNEHVFYLYPKKTDSEYLLKQAEYICQNFGANGFLIDPLNTLNVTSYNSRDDINISLFLADFKRLCEEYNLWGALVAHPSKEGMIDRETGAEKPPNPAYTKGAGELYTKPDGVLIIHREKDITKNPRRMVEVYIKKVRGQDLGVGELGKVELYYNIKTGRLEDQYTANLDFTTHRYGKDS